MLSIMTKDGVVERSGTSSYSFEDLAQETFAAKSPRARSWERDPFDDFFDGHNGGGTGTLSSRSERTDWKPPRSARNSLPSGWNEVDELPIDVPPAPRRRPRSPVGSNQGEIKLLPPPRSRQRSELAPSWVVKMGPWPWRLGWALAVIMVGRLIFSDGGLIDYGHKKNVLAQKESEYKALVEENNSLQEEIYRIRNIPRVQKELARSHLGLISRDEYLVMFAQPAPAK